MEKEIKNPEKMNENKEMQTIDENDLGEVAGGSFINTIKEKWQRFRMSKEEREEIIFLLNSYNRDLRSPRMMYGGLDYFKRRGAIVEKLKAYAKKYPNIPELEPFRN